MVHAVVLAAGFARRAGPEHKLLAELEGRSVIARTLDVLEAGGIGAMTLVLGHRADEVRAAAALGPRGAVVNALVADGHAGGMGASLAAGIAAVPRDAEAVLVALGDMPLVDPRTVRRLVERFEAAGDPAAILLPAWRGRRGHPVLWGRAHLASLAALGGDRGGRDVLARAAHHVGELAVADPGVLADLDDAAAIERARALVRGEVPLRRQCARSSGGIGEPGRSKS